MALTWSESGIKDLLKTHLNRIEGLTVAFTDADMTDYLDEASLDVPFDFPTDSSASGAKEKYKAYRNRTLRAAYWDLFTKKLHYFEVNRKRLQQIVDTLKSALNILDNEFKATKSGEWAYLFIGTVHNILPKDLVWDSGFVTDEFGQDLSYREETRSATTGTSIRRPKATDLLLDYLIGT